jgi:hypothetical protein
VVGILWRAACGAGGGPTSTGASSICHAQPETRTGVRASRQKKQVHECGGGQLSSSGECR